MSKRTFRLTKRMLRDRAAVERHPTLNPPETAESRERQHRDYRHKLCMARLKVASP